MSSSNGHRPVAELVEAAPARRWRRGDRVRRVFEGGVGIVEGWTANRVLVLWGVMGNRAFRTWDPGGELEFVAAGPPYVPGEV